MFCYFVSIKISALTLLSSSSVAVPPHTSPNRQTPTSELTHTARKGTWNPIKTDTSTSTYVSSPEMDHQIWGQKINRPRGKTGFSQNREIRRKSQAEKFSSSRANLSWSYSRTHAPLFWEGFSKRLPRGVSLNYSSKFIYWNFTR